MAQPNHVLVMLMIEFFESIIRFLNKKQNELLIECNVVHAAHCPSKGRFYVDDVKPMHRALNDIYDEHNATRKTIKALHIILTER